MDAAVFLYQDQVWMLDCGDEHAYADIVPLLKHLGLTRIDKLINTHPHHDHLNGLYAVDEAVPVSELMICFPEDATEHSTAAMEYCKGNGIKVSTFSDESLLLMGDGFVTFLAWQKVDEEENMNNRSAQFMISYGQCNMFTMADMETRGQKQLYAALGDEPPLAADILRYPHHGMKGMFEPFYDAVHPSLVIITNAPRTYEIVDSSRFLDSKRVPVAYTNRKDVVIHLLTDGNHWLCEDVPFDPIPYLQPTPEPAE